MDTIIPGKASLDLAIAVNVSDIHTMQMLSDIKKHIMAVVHDVQTMYIKCDTKIGIIAYHTSGQPRACSQPQAYSVHLLDFTNSLDEIDCFICGILQNNVTNTCQHLSWTSDAKGIILVSSDDNTRSFLRSVYCGGNVQNNICEFFWEHREDNTRILGQLCECISQHCKQSVAQFLSSSNIIEQGEVQWQRYTKRPKVSALV